MTSAISGAVRQQVPLQTYTADFNNGTLINNGNVAGGLGGMNPYTKIIGSAVEDAGKWEQDIGNALVKAAQQKAIRQAYQNYMDYATGIASQMENSLNARAEKYDQKLQDQFNEAEPQYLDEANTQLKELAQLRQDIADEASEAQRANQRQINATLAQQGVRGGQAAILANRATGELNRDLQRDINQAVYNEAANRQSSRLNYFGQKAFTPWKEMSNAYGQSMIGANNSLSRAQGNVYENAYNTALNNYLGTQNTDGKGWQRYLGGWMSMSGQHAQNAGQKMQQM